MFTPSSDEQDRLEALSAFLPEDAPQYLLMLAGPGRTFNNRMGQPEDVTLTYQAAKAAATKPAVPNKPAQVRVVMKGAKLIDEVFKTDIEKRFPKKSRWVLKATGMEVEVVGHIVPDPKDASILEQRKKTVAAWQGLTEKSAQPQDSTRRNLVVAKIIVLPVTRSMSVHELEVLPTQLQPKRDVTSQLTAARPSSTGTQQWLMGNDSKPQQG